MRRASQRAAHARTREVLRPDSPLKANARPPPGQMACLSSPVSRRRLGSRIAVLLALLVVYNDESYYTYLPSDARAVRSQRRDDARAERCLRVGRDQAALRAALGVHVVDFTWF